MMIFTIMFFIKMITNKWQINYFTYFYFFLAFLCGYFKNSCFIFLIVIIHELGHILTIKLFKYQIISITLYPFGGITKIDCLSWYFNAIIIKFIYS